MLESCHSTNFLKCGILIHNLRTSLGYLLQAWEKSRQTRSRLKAVLIKLVILMEKALTLKTVPCLFIYLFLKI